MPDYLYDAPQPDDSQYLYPAGNQQPTVAPDVAQQRAQKYDLAMGDHSPGVDQTANNILTGLEDQDRQRTAMYQMLDERKTKLDMLDQYTKAKEGLVTPDETNAILSLTKDEMSNPQTIMEKLYARKAIPNLLYAGENPTFDSGLAKDPDGTHTALDGAEHLLTFKEGAQKLLEDTEAKIQDQSWVGWGSDYLSSWIPFATAGNLANATGDQFNTYSGMVTKLKDKLLFMPVDQGLAELKKVSDDLANRNPQEAAQFLRHMIQYSSQDQVMDDVMIHGGDIAAVAGGAVSLAKSIGAGVKAVQQAGEVAKGATAVEAKVAEGLRASPIAEKTAEAVSDIASDAAKATPEQQVRKGLLDTVKAMFSRTKDPVEELAAAGHVDEAAQAGVIQQLRQMFSSGLSKAGEVGGVNDYRTNMPSLFNTQSFFSQTSKVFSLEQQRRILNAVIDSTPDLLKSMTSGLKINRLNDSPEMMFTMAKQAQQKVRLQYPNLVDNIIDARPEVIPGPTGYIHQVGVVFGDENASLFKSAKAATKSAQMNGFSEFRIRQQGTGFAYVVNKTVDETDPQIRSLLLETDNKTPRSLATMMWGMLRSPEDKISAISRGDRKVSVYGIGELTSFFQDSAARIATLPKKSRRDLFDFIERDRAHESTVMTKNGTRTEVGRFAQTLQEFENRWYENFGKAPSEGQVAAYLEYKRLNEVDWAYRNFRLYRDKARLGVENLTFGTTNKVEATTVKDGIPWNQEGDAGILVLRKDQEPVFFRKNDKGVYPVKRPGSGTGADYLTNQAMVDELLSGNSRAFHVSPFGDQRLRADDVIGKVVGDDKVHFVVSDNYKIDPLSLQQLPYRAGGHIAYPDGFYVAQSKITSIRNENRYDGDQNLWNFTSEAQAREFAKDIDTVRVMLKNGVSEDAVSNFIERSKLPKTPEEILALFKPKLDGAGAMVEPAKLNLNEAISVRGAGQRLGDLLDLKNKYTNFKDSALDPHNLYADMSHEYTGRRGELIETAENVGSETNPIYRTRPARFVDVMTTMNRAMKGMIEARFLDDLKVKEVEKFVQEFGHTLSIPKEELARNPMKVLMNDKVPWNEGADRMELTAAKNSLLSLKQFIGVKDPWSQDLRWIKNKVLNSVYSHFGAKGVDFAEPLLMYATKDPLKYARGLAFHLKLGLFNPIQVFLQAQTYFHMAGIAGPKIALQAGPAAFLMRGLRFTEDANIIDKFAGFAGKHGWNSEDFKQAYTALRESGMDRVAGEVAMRDDVFDPKMVQTALGKFSDWSTMFFNEGERFTRVAAYNASYLEWRAANPVGKLTTADKSRILDRADLMSGNMTRASNAAWQKGWASIPTQFFAYQARIAEQLLGKRLTGMEKMRVLGMYSAIYGVPVAASAGTVVWPWGDTLRSQLMARGYNYDDNVISRGLMDGLTSVMLQTALGTKFNFGDRYGPGGMNTFRDWLTGTKDGVETLLGVSGSSIKDSINAVSPILNDVADAFSSDPNKYPMFMEDLITATRTASSVNNALKMVYSLNTGRYVTEHEMYMEDVTPLESVFMGLTGLTPSREAEAYTRKQILSDEASAQRQAAPDIIKNIRRAIKSSDPDEINAHMSRAKSLMIGTNMDIHQQSQVMMKAMKGWESFVDQQAWDFARSKPERMQQFIDNQKNQ